MDPVLEKLMEGKSIPERMKIAKAFGFEYKVPSITAQTSGKGRVELTHRGRSMNDSQFVVIDEVYLPNGKTIPGLICDPRTARIYALEMLRICEEYRF